MESGPTPNEPVPKAGEIVLYRTEDGRTRVECRFVDETLWLKQALIGELFQKDVRTINEHLQNIYAEGELDEEATIRKFRIVRRESVRDVEREIEHYNLDAILAVGYRVRSERGTLFRRWATERLREYLVKGFTMDDQRLKNPSAAGSGVPDYFDELRSEERRVGKEGRSRRAPDHSSRRRHTRYIGDWSSDVCSSDLVKGFTMDDQRLKNPSAAGSGVPDYFDEL